MKEQLFQKMENKTKKGKSAQTFTVRKKLQFLKRVLSFVRLSFVYHEWPKI